MTRTGASSTAAFGIALVLEICAMDQADAAPRRLYLDCQLSSTVEAGDAFCVALEAALETGLGVAVSRRPAGQQMAVRVQVSQRSAVLADVTISTGEISQGDFRPSATTKSQLTSTDSKLSAGAAQTLVFVIGKQLGLVR